MALLNRFDQIKLKKKTNLLTSNNVSNAPHVNNLTNQTKIFRKFDPKIIYFVVAPNPNFL